MKIAIDAGHGLHTPGKRCLAAIDPRETREWQLNSRIAARVCSELERLGCETIRADDPTGQRDVPLAARAQAANRAGCAWYVSIHHDSGIGGGTGGGVTVFSHPSAGHASHKLREAVYRQVVRETGLKGNRSQPLREADFAVLRETDMPAVLIECGFMDSKTDTPLILTADFARRAADGIVQAVCEVGGIAYKPKSSEMEDNMNVYKHTADLPSWARDTFVRLVQAGVVSVDGKGEIAVQESSLQPMVYLDRLCGGQIERLGEAVQ